MKFTIYGKNMHVSDGLKDALKKKFSKFERYFGPDTEVYATFSKEKNFQMLEVTVPLGRTVLRAEEKADDLLSAIEIVVDKLEGQLRKHKTRFQKNYAEEARKYHFDELEDYPDYDEEQEEGKVVRTKKFQIKPMHVEEAALQMEMLGHDFFVFQEAESDSVCVVYRRRDGNYGLIEPYV